jgi:hypothetical protein
MMKMNDPIEWYGEYSTEDGCNEVDPKRAGLTSDDCRAE